MDEKRIKQEAKEILDKFAKALEKVEMKESFVERDEDKRGEGQGSGQDSDFQKIFFENAPDLKDKCVLAEKGKWK